MALVQVENRQHKTTIPIFHFKLTITFLNNFVRFKYQKNLAGSMFILICKTMKNSNFDAIFPC